MKFGPYRGVVDLVHDGDTISAQLDLGFDLKVYTRIRVYGINAPELSTPEGKAALEFAKTLLSPTEDILVVSHGWDKYGGRIDGEITRGDGVDFGTAMVEAGHAVRVKY